MSLQLIPIADEMVKLSATCNMCKTNKAILHTDCATTTSKLLLGVVIYQPLCRMCETIIDL